MIIKRQVKNIYNFYSQEYLRKYNQNKTTLINAFVKFYGEPYRDYITYTINNMQIYFYLMNEDTPKEIQPLIRAYFWALNRKYSALDESSPNFDSLAKEIIDSVFLGDMDKSDLYANLKRDIVFDFGDSYGYMFLNRGNKQTYKDIALNVFGVDDLTLIHEINHVICTHVLFSINGELKAIDPLGKASAVELINELIAKKILKIFRSLGGMISKKTVCESKEYNSKMFLVNDFYGIFDDIINETLVTGNTFLLEKKLGEDYITRYLELVDRLYDCDTILKEDIFSLVFLLGMMKQHLAREQDYNYDAYYAELESAGYKVRKLKKSFK